jgi:hypothetical protein
VQQLDANEVRSVTIEAKDQVLQVTINNGTEYSVNYPDKAEVEKLLAGHPGVNVIVKTRSVSWSSWPYVLLPLGLLAALVALAAIIV